MACVLFVDDDKNLLTINSAYFQRHGYETAVATDRVSALSILDHKTVDCIVLDILLSSGEEGFDLCEELKTRTDTPVLFLTCLTGQEYLYRGFAVGGDDYLTKPYDLKELLLRVEARLRRGRNHDLNANILHFPPMTIDTASRQVTINGRLVSLTGNEFDILLLLATSDREPFSPERIYQQVWKMAYLDSVQTVRVCMARLRQKLDTACPEHRFIQTAWGKGYLFVPAPSLTLSTT